MNSNENDSPECSSDEVKKLRRFFEKCWPEAIKKVMKIIISFHEFLAKQKIGHRKIRIGVFGPYPGMGKKIILQVARYVSDLGFAAITGDGYYLPHDSTNFHDIKEISPPVITQLFEHPEVPQYLYYSILPRLVAKAIFLMNDERGQTIELIGCFDAGIPVLGFITHDIIKYGDRDCVYLSRTEKISACVVHDHLSCLGNCRKRPRCPFYDSINISWLNKQLFLRRKDHHLIAVRRVQDLEPALVNFIVEGSSRESLPSAVDR